MLKILLYIPLFFLFFSCSSKNDKINESQNIVSDSSISDVNENINYQFFENYTDYSFNKLRVDSVLIKGDTNVYRRLLYDYFYSNHAKEFLFYAIYMAERHNYLDAYMDVYNILERDENVNTIKYSRYYKLWIDYFLIKTYLTGNRSAKSFVEYRFGSDLDSSRLVRYYNRLEKHMNVNIKY